jgi:hypothetical protein
MAKVKLTHDTQVRFAKGTVLEVSEAEASRLFAFNNAVPAEEEKKPAAKAAKSKK